MNVYLAEFVGTFLLVFLGDGVVANSTLAKTKGHNAGSLAINIGWACAVLIPALIFGPHSGGHFNPALSLCLAIIDWMPMRALPMYIAAQMAGAFAGAVAMWAMYRDHFDSTEDKDTKLGVFCTGPAIRNTDRNFVSEVMATFFLAFAVIGINQSFTEEAVAGVRAFAVAAIIFAAGASLGGTTGYAINPARDLAPRLAYAVLPIKDKRDPDWAYSWIPVLGPAVGGVMAALLANIMGIS